MEENRQNRFFAFMRENQKILAFLGGQGISIFGSTLVQYAIMWYITRTTDSGLMLTISMLCGFVPQFIVSLFAGVWADRHNRKLLIIAADGMIGLSTLALALIMWSGYTELWLLFAISIVRSFGAGVQSPAVSAMLPQIVPQERLMRINGVYGTLFSLINIFSPIVGAMILQFAPLYVLLFVDVVTALIGISILTAIHVPKHAKAMSKQESSALADLKEGVRYVFRKRFFRWFFSFQVLFAVLIVPAAFLNVLLVTRVFGEDYSFLMWNEVVFSSGALLGGLLIAAWGGFSNRLHTMALACVVFGACTFALGIVEVFWVYLAFMFLDGIVLPLFNTPITVLIQEKVEPDMLGRVFSIMQIISSSIMPLSMMVIGPLADRISVQTITAVSGALMLLIGAIVMQIRSFMAEGAPATKAAPKAAPEG